MPHQKEPKTHETGDFSIRDKNSSPVQKSEGLCEKTEREAADDAETEALRALSVLTNYI